MTSRVISAALALSVTWLAVTGSAPLAQAGDAPSNQRYLQYVDAETGVIKRPEGEGWSDPFGDGVWRSSWFYGSLLIIRQRNPDLYSQIVQNHGTTADHAKLFLTYFNDHNTGADEWTLPKNPSQKFSRDQLTPLLFLLAAVYEDAPELQPVAKEVLQKLVDIVKAKGAVSNSTQGKVHDNLRYVIAVLTEKYGIDYVDGATRGHYKTAFSAALKLYGFQVQLPGDLATMDDYSVFNSLSLVTLQALIWGTDDGDVKDWRANFKQHADKGWGPAFRIAAGRSISDNTIAAYSNARVKRSQDNDIILAQRPHKFLSGDFPPQNADNADAWLVLDFVLLKAMQLACH